MCWQGVAVNENGEGDAKMQELSQRELMCCVVVVGGVRWWCMERTGSDKTVKHVTVNAYHRMAWQPQLGSCSVGIL